MWETGPINIFKQNAVTIWIDLKASGIVCAIEHGFKVHSALNLLQLDPRQAKVIADLLRSHIVHNPQCPRAGDQGGHVAVEARTIGKTVAPHMVEPCLGLSELEKMIFNPMLILLLIDQPFFECHVDRPVEFGGCHVFHT